MTIIPVIPKPEDLGRPVPPGWMQVSSGKGIDIDNPRVEDIDWHDIATSLSMLCRFNGHVAGLDNFYSVAQHSVVVADLLPEPIQIYGILHDAHETILGDDVTPKKRLLRARWPDAAKWLHDKKAEWDAVIWEAAGVPPPDAEIRAAVAQADALALAIEHRSVQRPALDDTTRDLWGGLPDPGRFQILPVSPRAAHDLFMVRLASLLWSNVGKAGVA